MTDWLLKQENTFQGLRLPLSGPLPNIPSIIIKHYAHSGKGERDQSGVKAERALRIEGTQRKVHKYFYILNKMKMNQTNKI